MPPTPPADPAPSPALARLLILLAAVGWSLSGAFRRLLDTPLLGLDEPRLTDLQIASGRAIFAGLFLLPFVRRREVALTPATGWTALSFALMNATFIMALGTGRSGSAVMLQYTAPLWVWVAGTCFLGEKGDPRGGVALAIGLVGVGLIAWGGWEESNLLPVGLGLASGLFFAGVILGLRAQRAAGPAFLTVANHLAGGLVLLPFLAGAPRPTWPQLGLLAVFGVVQMGLPYFLMAQGLRRVGPAEAATLSLLEPILNPVWAWLVAPDRERPTVWLALGGACVVGALAWRYWPTRADGRYPEP
ncbi:MAG: EamA family transporter [Gemmataceae bacterium]|nr:EamA family transporter [Gemmataceae bacterium]